MGKTPDRFASGWRALHNRNVRIFDRPRNENAPPNNGVDYMASLIGISRTLSQAPHYRDPEHWRERAEETRVIAERMIDPVARSMMLRIAEDYERMARHAMDRI